MEILVEYVTRIRSYDPKSMSAFSTGEDLPGQDSSSGTTTTTTTDVNDLAAQIAALRMQNAQLKEKKPKAKKCSSASSSDSSSSSSESSSSSSDSSSSDDDGSDSDEGEKKSSTSKNSNNNNNNNAAFTTNEADDDFFDQLSGDAPKGDEEIKVEGHEYSVNLPRHTSGPGIVWETDFEGKRASVKAFKRLDDGQYGPAANSGIIDIGHILIAVDGKRMVGKAFEEQVKYVERASKKHKGKGEYVLTMVDAERRVAKEGTTTSSKTSSSVGKEMNQALKEIHRNKLQYYQAVPSEEMTLCFLERYRGDHVTSFHMHRQSDSAFVMAASMPCAMKGDVVFHTLQDMTWEATMKDISTGTSFQSFLSFIFYFIFFCVFVRPYHPTRYLLSSSILTIFAKFTFLLSICCLSECRSNVLTISWCYVI